MTAHNCDIWTVIDRPYQPVAEVAKTDFQIGIGASVTRRPLPHHRAYGSVHGGSSQLRERVTTNEGRPR